MSLYALASGELVADPVRRTSAKGSDYATALLRGAMGGDGSALVSIVAFGSAAERLLSLSKGAAVAASGRAELKSWTAKDGTGRTGLSIVASEIAAARPKPRTRDGAPRQRSAYRRPGARPAAPQFDRADLPRLNDPIDDLWPARAS